MTHALAVAAKNISNAMVSKLVLSVMMTFCVSVMGAQVIIKEEPEVIRLMQVYKSTNQQEPTIKGWRIQIIATSNRSEMERTITRFERLYPQIDYNWEHNAPYYQVRIGAYEKKEDLEAFILKLKKEFPMSIPIKDDINKTELIQG